MKAALITIKGLERTAQKEVYELIGKKSKIIESAVVFECSKEELYELAYFSQSATRIVQLLGHFSFEIKKDLLEKAQKLNYDAITDTFVVRTTRVVGEHDFESIDLEKEIGAIIHEQGKPVDLQNPKQTAQVNVCENYCIIGVDIASIDLSKRDYKIFSIPASIKGTLAYNLVRLSGFDSSKKLLDPFCADGSTCIEAAIFASKKSINKFRKIKLKIDADFDAYEKKTVDSKARIIGYDNSLHNIKASQKNAKIADVNKLITFSRVNVEWLDTKIEQESVDCIASNPPFVSRNHRETDIKKLYDELFYQAKYVLKKTGKIALLARSESLLIEAATKHDFKAVESLTVQPSKQSETILILQKL
ncbi:methyltransferase [Candidatus Woesearchaeota archaeon]|nr:methyltransferase [Candidatus Woesearchaeota archaeon]